MHLQHPKQARVTPPWVIRPSIPADCVYIAENIRHDDLMELKASGCEDPFLGVVDCFERSDQPFTGVWDGHPCCIFGVVRIKHRYFQDNEWRPRGMGSPWLLGTEAIMDSRWVFLAENKKWLDDMSRGYDFLWNRVHIKNTVHLKWLKWLGFELGDDVVLPSGETFTNFSKVVHSCASLQLQ